MSPIVFTKFGNTALVPANAVSNIGGRIGYSRRLFFRQMQPTAFCRPLSAKAQTDSRVRTPTTVPTTLMESTVPAVSDNIEIISFREERRIG